MHSIVISTIICLGSFLKVVYILFGLIAFRFFLRSCYFYQIILEAIKGWLRVEINFRNDYALKWQSHLSDVKLLAREPLVSS